MGNKKSVSVTSETERATRQDSAGIFSIVAGLPPAVFTLGHVLAMSDESSGREIDFPVGHVQACR